MQRSQNEDFKEFIDEKHSPSYTEDFNASQKLAESNEVNFEQYSDLRSQSGERNHQYLKPHFNSRQQILVNLGSTSEA